MQACAFAAAMGLSSVASAGTIVDTVEQDEFLAGTGASVTYFHDLNPGPDANQSDWVTPGSALSGTLSIAISDDGGFFDFPEAILFLIEDFDFDTGTVTFGSSFNGELGIQALGALNGNGMLDVSVVSILGDFYVGDSVLTVTVPEPGTLALLGLGLAGLGFANRRKKNNV